MNAIIKKTILFKLDMGRGNSAWVEKTAYGVIAAKVDGHPDDPIYIAMIGTAKECYKAVVSTVRAVRKNRLGKVMFGKHAPKGYPQNIEVQNQRLFPVSLKH